MLSTTVLAQLRFRSVKLGKSILLWSIFLHSLYTHFCNVKDVSFPKFVLLSENFVSALYAPAAPRRVVGSIVFLPVRASVRPSVRPCITNLVDAISWRVLTRTFTQLTALVHFYTEINVKFWGQRSNIKTTLWHFNNSGRRHMPYSLTWRRFYIHLVYCHARTHLVELCNLLPYILCFKLSVNRRTKCYTYRHSYLWHCWSGIDRECDL